MRTRTEDFDSGNPKTDFGKHGKGSHHECGEDAKNGGTQPVLHQVE